MMDTTNSVTYPDVVVELTGTDGNAFAIIGTVRKAIREEIGLAEAQEFSNEAMESGSYDELLQLVLRTVVVE